MANDKADIDQRVFKFIVGFKRSHDGVPPSYDEIVDGAKLSSKSYVRLSLDRLVTDGKIELIDGKQNGIMVVGGRWAMGSENRPAYRANPVKW